jgi:hypothetical protein
MICQLKTVTEILNVINISDFDLSEAHATFKKVDNLLSRWQKFIKHERRIVKPEFKIRKNLNGND